MSRRILVLLLAAGIMAASGCMTGSGAQEEPGTISVSATGTVSQAPDIARLSVGYAYLADTTREARDAVNRRMHEVMEILARQGVGEQQIQLSQLSISPEYTWGEQRRILTGQRVRQSLYVTVEEFDTLGSIIDSIGDLQGIELSSVMFSIKDAAELHAQARELAFARALAKAGEFASLSGMTLGAPLSIREDSAGAYEPIQPGMLRAELADTSETAVPGGELEISVRVSVTFGMHR